MKLVSYDKKFGILIKGSIFNLETFEEVKPETYAFLHASKLQNLPNQELNKEFLKSMRKKFPYTKIDRTYVFHINLIQKFFVKINKDNTMNIYSGYPISVLKQFLKFIEKDEK
jgi:hypothetical protein